MSYMQKILSGVKVDALLEQIEQNPSLWDRYTLRTQLQDTSPHREVSDIWLRYRDYSEFDANDPQAFAGEHVSQWYAAAYELPEVMKIIDNIFTLVDGEELGGCLITKIPPGCQVYPHSDAGYWHSEYYLSKYLLLLQSAPGQSFEFGEERHEGEAGDLFIFDNRPIHSVINNSETDRISLIMAVKQKAHDVPVNERKDSICSQKTTTSE